MYISIYQLYTYVYIYIYTHIVHVFLSARMGGRADPRWTRRRCRPQRGRLRRSHAHTYAYCSILRYDVMSYDIHYH